MSQIEANEDIIDVETYAKSGRTPPKGRQYRIRVDKQLIVVATETITGREILRLAGKQPPERFRLDQKLMGGKTVKIELTQVVDLTTPGVERFMTLPLDQTEGSITSSPSVRPAEPVIASVPPRQRREFMLPDEDVLHLNARGLPWETILSQGERWLLVHGFPLPSGYNQREVTVAIHIVGGYPIAPLDMVYAYPPMARADGRAIGALTMTMIDGRAYQRWSRHRTSENPWRPGVDDIAAHVALVEEWFAREFRR